MNPEIRNLEVRLMHARHEFVRAFEDMQAVVHAINREKGFWLDRQNIVAACSTVDEDLIEPASRQIAIATLGLVGTEVSEAIEAARKHPPESWGTTTEKDTLVREMAGATVRAMDMAGANNWRLGEAIVEELQHNLQRPFLHGKQA